MHAFTTLLFVSLPLLAYTQSTGTTTRYWDCCKASCSWPGKSSAVNQPVNTCDANNNVLTDFNSASGCTGGSAYMCANQTPIVIDSNTAYGYAAVALSAGTESDWCCACYELTFTSGPVAGKKMVVQATNTGGGLSDGNHFDIAIPGGGVGQFNACTKQYGAPTDGWGARYGGVSSRAECAALPAALREGCYWRFDWFKGADNPEVTWRQVTCPSQLTARTGCRRYR